MATFEIRKALIVLVLVLGLILLYPWKTTVVPKWRVRIVDQSGAPLRNTGVREVWQHYSIESKSHEQDLTTDNEGYVTFPTRTIRSPLAIRIVRTIINALNPHHGSGPIAWVIVLEAEYDTWSNNAALPGQSYQLRLLSNGIAKEGQLSARPSDAVDRKSDPINGCLLGSGMQCLCLLLGQVNSF